MDFTFWFGGGWLRRVGINQRARAGGGGIWRLEGVDGLSGETYPYDSIHCSTEHEALKIADSLTTENRNADGNDLYRSINDQVWVVRPDGSRYQVS